MQDKRSALKHQQAAQTDQADIYGGRGGEGGFEFNGVS